TDLVFGGTPRLHYEEVYGSTVVDKSASVQDSLYGTDWHKPYHLPSQPAYLAAVLLLLGGAGAGMVIRQRFHTVVSAAVAFSALGVLLLGHVLVAWHFAHLDSTGSAAVTPAYGLWLAGGMLLVLGTGNVVAAVVSRRAPTTPTGPDPSARSGSG